MKIQDSLIKTLCLTSLLAVGATSCALARVSNSSRNPAQAGGKMLTFESDANGFNTKNFFYDNGQEVVVFDTQFTPELAQQSLAAIRAQTQNPITYVIITHPNPDKFNGMSVFQKLGAKVIASTKTALAMPGVHAYKKYFFVNMAHMFTDQTYPQLSSPDMTFDQAMDLRLGNGEVISLRELSAPGVSSNQTIAYVPGAKAVVVGDLIHHKAHAWLEGGIVQGKATPTLQGWISDLVELKSMFRNQSDILVYGGRGEVAALDLAVNEQIQYLQRADDLVTNYVRILGPQKSELLSDKAQNHYQRMTKVFETQFLDYKLSYMIQYGVYGLMNSKL